MESERKRLQADTIIALTALVVSLLGTVSSTIATFAVVRQTDVVAKQLSSTVWPYLSIDTQASNTGLTLTLANDGLGPALLRAITVRLDGRPQQRLSDGIVPLLHGIPGVGHGLSLHFSGTTGGMVLRPAENVTLLSVHSAAAFRIGQRLSRLEISVCYCSLLGDCWTTGSGGVNSRVADCAAAAKHGIEGEDASLLTKLHAL